MRGRAGRPGRLILRTEARAESALCGLQFIGSLLVVIGFFGPWVAHKTAALTATGYELSEFAKFFPQVQSGSVPVRRALFITPLLASVVSLALGIQRSGRSLLLRMAATALIALVGFVALPPFRAALEPQYRLHLALVVGGSLLTLLTPLGSQLSEHARGILLLLLAFVGAVPALWQAVLLRPLVAELYGAPIWPGWGLIVCVSGFLTIMLAGLGCFVRS